MKWRLIELEVHDAFTNMALDEAVSEAVGDGENPTIRFYKWLPSAVSIGYFQSLLDEVNVEKCEELGVDIVRRRTGGGSVFHDSSGEITYSVIAPENVFPKDITKSYQEICGWIVNAFSLLGLESEFKPVNDIIIGGKKISGNAQTRRGGVLLQHGTILFDLDLRKMFSVLKVGADKISDKMIKSAEERVTCVRKLISKTEDDVVGALRDAFTVGKDYTVSGFSDAEVKRAKELVKSRYKTKGWNYRR